MLVVPQFPISSLFLCSNRIPKFNWVYGHSDFPCSLASNVSMWIVISGQSNVKKGKVCMIKMVNVCIFDHIFFKKVKCEYSTSCLSKKRGCLQASPFSPTRWLEWGPRECGWWATFQTMCMGSKMKTLVFPNTIKQPYLPALLIKGRRNKLLPLCYYS